MGGGIRLQGVAGLGNESWGWKSWKQMRMVNQAEIKEGCTRLHEYVIQETSYTKGKGFHYHVNLLLVQ
jgi:hypothetical protein